MSMVACWVYATAVYVAGVLQGQAFVRCCKICHRSVDLKSVDEALVDETETDYASHDAYVGTVEVLGEEKPNVEQFEHCHDTSGARAPIPYEARRKRQKKP